MISKEIFRSFTHLKEFVGTQINDSVFLDRNDKSLMGMVTFKMHSKCLVALKTSPYSSLVFTRLVLSNVKCDAQGIKSLVCRNIHQLFLK